MESGIVEGFQNLHVLPDSEITDHVVRELATGHDESSPRSHRKALARHGEVGCTIRHPVKKRRCKKRKSAAMITGPVIGANVSEGLDGGSTSDSDGAGTLTRQMYMDCVSRLSDSDSMAVTGNHQSIVIPTVATNALVESDSVTENWSPLRPQRRRRHLRRMVVDDACEQPVERRHVLQGSMPATVNKFFEGSDLLMGKRKRGVKDKSDNSFECDSIHEEVSQHKSPDCIKMLESGASSSVSSDESEVGNNCNEYAADGDDEQSDFYVEPESSASRQTVRRTSSRDSDSEYTGVPVDFDSLLSGNWDLMSPASQSHLKARFKLLSGRQYQAGRRRITDRTRPPYLFSCFLQDRQRWDQTSSTWCPNATWYQTNNSTCNDSTGGGGKRHRLMATSEQAADVGCESNSLVTDSACKLSSFVLPPSATLPLTATDPNLRVYRRKLV